MKRIWIVIASLTAVFGLNSCAVSGGDSQVGAGQPHAVVTTKRIFKSAVPYITSTTAVYEIDGKQPSSMRLDDTFRVSPGKHRFNLTNIRYDRGASADLELNAEAGKRYVIQSDGVGDKVKFWVEETGSGKIVASIWVKDEVRQLPPMPIIITVPTG